MGHNSIDQIILSCNEDPIYREFFEPVAQAYRYILPGVKVHLAFLTNKKESDPEIKEMRKHGRVTLFKPLPHIQEFAQAKMIRFILASRQEEDVCYVDDIDLYPLDDRFITSKTDARKKGHLLCVGGEVYSNNGCYPISQMTAEGDVWQRFINPNHKSYAELMEEWSGEIMFDRREDVTIPLDFTTDSYFSDERLLRRLWTLNSIPRQEMIRGYDNYLEATIDRHTFDGKEWVYDREKLDRGGYFNAHGIRPYRKNEAHYRPLVHHVMTKYGGMVY